MSLLSCFSIAVTIITLVIYYSKKEIQRYALLVASILFMLVYCPIGLLSILVESLIIFYVIKCNHNFFTKKRKLILCLSVILSFYITIKYLLHIGVPGLSLLNTSKVFSITISLGSAYFILRLISFSADYLNGKIVDTFSYCDFLIYLIYFPAIIQGPVERFDEFQQRIRKIHVFSFDNLNSAVFLILFGLFKIYAIAKVCAQYNGSIFSKPEQPYSVLYIIFCILIYSLQIYADFSGGIDVARGISFLFDIELTENFRTPYFSKSFSEFWKRWHISFSSWLKDYIYIPLGGNRKGKARKYLNQFAVFFVSGLWHGITLPFIIWGLLQAVYVVSESAFGNKKKKEHPVMQNIKVFSGITFSWIFFSAGSMEALRNFVDNVISSVKFTPAYISQLKLSVIGISETGIRDLAAIKDLVESVFSNYLLSNGYSYLLLCPIIFAFFIGLEHILYKKNLDIVSFTKNKKGLSSIMFLVLICVVIFFGFWGDSYSASSFIYGGF